MIVLVLYFICVICRSKAETIETIVGSRGKGGFACEPSENCLIIIGGGKLSSRTSRERCEAGDK